MKNQEEIKKYILQHLINISDARLIYECGCMSVRSCGMARGGVGHRLSPVGSGATLSPGDFDTRRRLSAPCGTSLQVDQGDR